MLCFIVSAIDEKKVLAISSGLFVVSSLLREIKVGTLEAAVFAEIRDVNPICFKIFIIKILFG